MGGGMVAADGRVEPPAEDFPPRHHHCAHRHFARGFGLACKGQSLKHATFVLSRVCLIGVHLRPSVAYRAWPTPLTVAARIGSPIRAPSVRSRERLPKHSRRSAWGDTAPFGASPEYLLSPPTTLS